MRIDTSGCVASYGTGEPTEPSVCCVMLTFDPARVRIARQAIACFNAQVYGGKMRLVIFDSREEWRGAGNPTIGQLRNEANALVEEDIIVHLDDDDFSHPARFAEQVALLQSSGADCVGYNEMLFWREPIPTSQFTALVSPLNPPPGEAWLYRNPDPHYALGTSLCYWRKTWERKPFEATSQGEDLRWIAGFKIIGVSAQMETSFRQIKEPMGCWETHTQPRMIARIHPGNTSTAYRPDAMHRESKKRNGMWKRVPEWDSYCAGVFA